VLEFHVELRQTGACAVVDVAGELDIATAPQLVAALGEANDAGAARIVVNLLATTFIDSSGLTTLFRAHKAHSDGKFSIVCAQDNLEVRRVMDLMGFTDVFTIHETLADADCDETS
jgi:anti-anti-sigma factor